MRLALIFLTGITILSCSKEQDSTPQPAEMVYKDLGDTSVAFGKFASFDIDGDHSKDFGFYTLLVGDSYDQVDKRQWIIMASFTTNLPTNEQESLPVMNKGTVIPIDNFTGYNWYNASGVVLVQKKLSNVTPPVWDGQWKNADHLYIPYQLIKAEGKYNGWIEISFSTTEEKLTIHSVAVSKEPGKPVIAGK